MGKDIHEGGCLCGEVRYQTEGNPQRVSVCHCRYCQLRTGSALGVSVYFDSQAVRIIRGQHQLKVHTHQTESGNHIEFQFCKECGTTILWKAELFSEMSGVGGGTFDPPTFWYDIEREVFSRSKADFIHIDVEDRCDDAPYYKPVIDEHTRLNGG